MKEDASGRRQRAVMATDAEWERIGRAAAESGMDLSRFVIHRALDWDPLPAEVVNGGGIMLHARRPGGPVAAAQNCATHGPLSVATRGGGCTAWSSMRRFDWRLSTRV